MGVNARFYFSSVNSMRVSASIKHMVSTTLWLILKVGKDPYLVVDTFHLFLKAFQMFPESFLYSGILRSLDIAVGVQIGALEDSRTLKKGGACSASFLTNNDLASESGQILVILLMLFPHHAFPVFFVSSICFLRNFIFLLYAFPIWLV